MSSNEADIEAFVADKHKMDKYSRQVGEYGVAAMAKLVQMKVMVIGLKGVGIEAAKNLILAGVGSVTLFDEDTVAMKDLGTNFYLKESDVSKTNCADASLEQLKSLNPLVKVSVHKGKLTNKHVKEYSVIVDCGLSPSEALDCNQHCRKYGVKYVRARVHGLVGYMFSDFGKGFTVMDKTGEQTVTRTIDTIETETDTPGEIIVRLIADRRHNIDFDDHVNFIKFEEVEGELGKVLNDTKVPFEVKENKRKNLKGDDVFDPFSLRVIVKDPKVKGLKYEGKGQILQVKQPVIMNFDSLEKNLLNPVHPDEGMMLFTDGMKFGRAEQLHIGLNALWRYEDEEKDLPPANDEAAINKILSYAKEYNAKMKENSDYLSVEELDEAVISNLARFAECNFQPLCCFYGGVVAQEVVKFTGKYTPLRQWVHLDCFEVLPELFVEQKSTEVSLEERRKKVVLPEDEVFIISDEDRKPIGSRYDDLIKIIGLPLHRKLMESSTFMVGCGALGCELLKNFALLGVACSEEKKGLITVTDNDVIEISNLSRQFLFRETNVGQLKSAAAKDSVQVMNPNINLKSLNTLVSRDSENVFGFKFWESLDFVTNALDNVQARAYVDSRCVFFGKPLLESGTLGIKCNSQIILPHLSASYVDGPKDDLGDAIPMCTLRHFPTTIVHCIEWARGRFTDLFETDSTKAVKYLNDPVEFTKDMRKKTLELEPKSQIMSAVAKELESLQEVYRILMTAKSSETNFETCVKEAYVTFHKFFRDTIQSLIKAHPADDLDELGNPFWNKKKRFPHVAKFDPNNETHLMFVLSMANILSMTYGLVSKHSDLVTDVSVVKQIVSGFTPPELEIQKITDTEEKVEDLVGGEVKEEEPTKDASDDEVEQFEKLLKDLEELATSEEIKQIKIASTSFEKDDDSNFHIDYITAASNLRADNYTIRNATRHKAKMISGKIIPALATTTAAVTGLVMIELLKVIQPGKKLEAFRDSSNSLGINGYFFMQPNDPIEEQDSTEMDPITLSKAKCMPKGYTKWDKLIIGDGTDMTLEAFLTAFNEHCKTKFEVDAKITCLLHENANHPTLKGHSKFLFNEGDEGKPSMQKSLKDLIVETYGDTVLADTYVKLDCSCSSEDEDFNVQDYKIPTLIYQFA